MRSKTPAKSTKRSKKKSGDAVPAYFLSLTVENVRCFGPAQRLDLSDGNGRPAQWTIILGDNGTGKTTLLRSLAAIFPTEFVLVPKNDPLRKYPTYVAKPMLQNIWLPLRGDPYLKLNSSHISSDLVVKAKLEQKIQGVKHTCEMQIGTTWAGYDVLSTEEFGNSVCFGYGAARRMASTTLTDNVEEEPYAGLFSNDVSLLNAEEWLLRADYAASKQSSTRKYATKRRDQIRQVLLRILPEVEDIKIGETSEKHSNLNVQFKTPYGWVRLQELSLGYITLIAWMVDFASRMFGRYPDSPNPLAEPAVCLVDEIDLHLHPSWQRKLVSFLTELFPNTQFIATAHSPLVVQAATNANIVLLKREGDHVVIDNSIESLRGWSVDQILTSELYGLESSRPPEFDAVIAERRQLLSKGRLTKKDKNRLSALEAEVEALPVGETPQDIRAMEIIRRAAARLDVKKDGKQS